MNKFTYRELKKIDHLIPNGWDENTEHIIVPNSNGIINAITLGAKFTVKLENYIINQPPNFTLSENWNAGTFPPEEILDVEVIQTVGQMTRVRAFGHNNRIEWIGWLPNKGFKVI